MKRSPMPPRTTPLPRSPLGRGAWLRASTSRKAATEAVTRGHGQAQPFPRVPCKLIDRRDSDDTGALPVRLCQRCGTSRDPQRHHRRGKSKGGSRKRKHSQCACNGILLCGTAGNGCHQWAHANPEQSRAEGWIVSQSVDEPGSVGVMRFAAAEGGATQWPSCDGRWLETAPEMREAVA